MPEIYFKILAAVAPAIVLLMIMIRRDRRPEPLGWLLAAVGLGILAGPAVLLLGWIILPNIQIDSYWSAFLSAFLDAAIPEECVKFMALWFLANRCKHFDEMFDGIVYAVCIGMGFAGLENILYLVGEEGGWLGLGISRALFSVPFHYFLAIIMGTFFSLAWFDNKNRSSYMSAALLLPIIVHGIYDSLCFFIGISKYLSSFILIMFLLGFRYIRSYVRKLTDSMLKLDSYGYPTR